MSAVIAHAIIRGRVQGVGYRAFVEDEVALRGLEGWVRNRSDGTVEALFAGEAEDVAQMIEACRKGPWSAQVDGVEHSEGTREQLAMRRVGEKFSVMATV
jgi:acylphosphatase